jgi:hypothetical protein
MIPKVDIFGSVMEGSKNNSFSMSKKENCKNIIM